MEIAEIRELMRAKGYDQSDLANLLGIDPSAVSKRLTGKRPFKHNEMVKTQAWLLGGAPAVELGGEAVRMLPIIGQVAAGSWKEAIQQPSGHLPLAASTAPQNGVVLVVQGDSMDLEIEEGGMVVVDPDDKALYPGHLFVILNEDGETTFKQFENDPARLVSAVDEQVASTYPDWRWASFHGDGPCHRALPTPLKLLPRRMATTRTAYPSHQAR